MIKREIIFVINKREEMMNDKRHLLNLLIIIIISIIVSGVTIYFIPDFITDDYCLFTNIDKVPDIPISLNPKIEFFLFFRPVSYFSFWLDYHLFYNNSVLMKIHSMFYFVLSIVLIYIFFLFLMKLQKKKVEPIILLLLSLIFVFHPNNLISIYWISNRTEILSFVFYILSILIFFKWLQSPLLKYRILITSFFLLAVLSKQSALNLPFVFIIFYKIIKKERIIHIIKKFTIEFSIVLIFLAVNAFTFSDESSIFITHLWKKIFSVLGILMYSFNELIGEKLYIFFLFHKYLAWLILLLLLAVSLFFYNKKRTKFLLIIKQISQYIFLLLLSLFPRIFAAGGRRLNTLQIFFLLVVFLLIFLEYKQYKIKKYFTVFLFLWLIITVINGVLAIKLTRQIKLNSEHKIYGLLSFTPLNDYLVLASDDIVLLPYQTKFYFDKKWGKLNFEVRTFRFIMLKFEDETELNARINVVKRDNKIIISTIGKTIINYLKQNETAVILENELSNSGRYGFSKIIIDENKLNPFNKKIIYYNGEKWLKLGS